MRKVKCIEHIWNEACSNPKLVFKWGSFVSFFEVCGVCGKTRMKGWWNK